MVHLPGCAELSVTFPYGVDFPAGMGKCTWVNMYPIMRNKSTPPIQPRYYLEVIDLTSKKSIAKTSPQVCTVPQNQDFQNLTPLGLHMDRTKKIRVQVLCFNNYTGRYVITDFKDGYMRVR